MKDYYEILGIEKNASHDDVKRAFRKLATKYHPDKKGGDEAKFKEISEAYAVLSDEKRRAEYDTYGRSFSGGQGGGAQGFGGQGFDWNNFAQGFGNGQGFEFDLGDIFGGFGDIFTGGTRAENNRGRDISIDVELSFRESIFGVERKVLLTKNSVCTHCKGDGAEPGSEMITCTTCNGNGKVRETRQSVLGAFTTVRACTTCHGNGKIPKTPCKECAGHGVRKKEEEIHLRIPAGIESGEMIRLTGKGEAIKGGAAGDLYVKVHVSPHPTITRDGSTLRSTLEIKVSDALLGAHYTVDTFDGPVSLNVPQGIKTGEQLRIKGKGVVGAGGSRGDFLVRIVISIPGKLSRNAKRLVEELRKEGI